MISTVQQSQEGLAPQAGGTSMSQRAEKFEPQWKGIAVLYVKAANGEIEFRLLYEAHIPVRM
jgi:hypothetical protein